MTTLQITACANQRKPNGGTRLPCPKAQFSSGSNPQKSVHARPARDTICGRLGRLADFVTSHITTQSSKWRSRSSSPAHHATTATGCPSRGVRLTPTRRISTSPIPENQARATSGPIRPSPRRRSRRHTYPVGYFASRSVHRIRPHRGALLYRHNLSVERTPPPQPPPGSFTFALCAALPDNSNGAGAHIRPAVGAFYAIATDGETLLSAPLSSVITLSPSVTTTIVCPAGI